MKKNKRLNFQPTLLKLELTTKCISYSGGASDSFMNDRSQACNFTKLTDHYGLLALRMIHVYFTVKKYLSRPTQQEITSQTD